jgi:hypothetical protein
MNPDLSGHITIHQDRVGPETESKRDKFDSFNT